MKRTNIVAIPGKHEVVIAHTFDAPRELVFKLYTNPEMIPQWWGPQKYSTKVEHMDVRPGGSWRVVQSDGDGNEYAFHGVYHDITQPTRIVRTFEFEGMPGHAMMETVTFVEVHGKTRVTDSSVFQSVEDRDGMIKTGMEEGSYESAERFAEILAKLQEAVKVKR